MLAPTGPASGRIAMKKGNQERYKKEKKPTVARLRLGSMYMLETAAESKR